MAWRTAADALVVCKSLWSWASLSGSSRSVFLTILCRSIAIVGLLLRSRETSRTPVRGGSSWQNTPQVKPHQVRTAGEHQPPEGAVGYPWLLWGAGTDHCSNLEAYDVARRAGTG